MTQTLIATALTAFPLFLLGWLTWRDRAKARALALRAEIDRAMRSVLGGESLVAVEVRPAAPWRRGRVVLSAPARWAWLVEAVLAPTLERIPPGYELVIHSEGRSQSVSAPTERTLAA
jgi:hypothetical protein